MKRPNRNLNVFSMSAIDLFASAMGAFLIIALVLFPYFLKNSDILTQLKEMTSRTEKAEAERDSSRKARAVAEESKKLADGMKEKAEKEKSLAIEAKKNAEEQNKLAIEKLKLAQKAQAAAKDNLARVEESERKAKEERDEAEAMIPKQLELVFICDTTSSMGKQLENLKKDISTILKTLKIICGNIRVGFVAYKDTEESSYITKVHSFEDVHLENFIKTLEVSGGGDIPEAMSNALERATQLNWKTNEDWNRVIVVITDAPAHKKDRSYLLAREFREGKWKGRVNCIYANKGDIEVEAFLKRLAKEGGGSYKQEGSDIITDLVESVFPKKK